MALDPSNSSNLKQLALKGLKQRTCMYCSAYHTEGHLPRQLTVRPSSTVRDAMEVSGRVSAASLSRGLHGDVESVVRRRR